jgi:death-on-curing protein
VNEWTWLRLDLVLAIHEEQLAEHGGGDGLRDGGALESALAKPQNLAAYDSPDAAALAASYAFGIARNHAFVDGNKRTAWVAARLFLQLNGVSLLFEDPEAVIIMISLASGELSEGELADWFREHVQQS